MRSWGLWALLALSSIAVAAPKPETENERLLKAAGNLSLELHAHLFMKEAMGFAFSGDFFGPLKATKWSDRFSSSTNPEALERSGIGIVVAALYAHPLFELSPREAVRKQIALARKFVVEHPNWIIARSAAEARKALISGKRAMILSLEGASGVIDSEADLEEFVDRGGIRIVNLLHLTDDEFGGVAFLAGFHVLASPWAWLKSFFRSNRDEMGVKRNTNGLSDRGRVAALSMIKHGVWLDMAHASDEALTELMPIASANGRPLLYTHTILRKYMKAERGISEAQLQSVKASGGFVGTMPAKTMLEGTPPSPGSKCSGAFAQFLTQYQEFVSVMGSDRVAFGSDWNGGVEHLESGCGTGLSLDAAQGYWNIGQAGELWKAMEKAGAPVPKQLGSTLARFLDTWERVETPKAPSSSSPSKR